MVVKIQSIQTSFRGRQPQSKIRRN